MGQCSRVEALGLHGHGVGERMRQALARLHVGVMMMGLDFRRGLPHISCSGLVRIQDNWATFPPSYDP